MYSPDSPFGAIPFLGPALPFFGKYITQATAGWTDFFTSEGLEKIENRDWNWDPKYKRLGTGPDLKNTQRNLEAAYKERTDVKPKYQEKSDLYDNYRQIINSQDALTGLLNVTGVDEALNYISLEQLTKMLESQ